MVLNLWLTDYKLFLWSLLDCFSSTTPHSSLKPLRVEPTHHNFSPLRSTKKAHLSMSFTCGAGGIVSAPQPRTLPWNPYGSNPPITISHPYGPQKKPIFRWALILWSLQDCFSPFTPHSKLDTPTGRTLAIPISHPYGPQIKPIFRWALILWRWWG